MTLMGSPLGLSYTMPYKLMMFKNIDKVSKKRDWFWRMYNKNCKKASCNSMMHDRPGIDHSHILSLHYNNFSLVAADCHLIEDVWDLRWQISVKYICSLLIWFYFLFLNLLVSLFHSFLFWSGRSASGKYRMSI